MSFSSLGLIPELTKAVADQGYDTPSPIQAAAIPHILEGKDVMAAAQTGTGKTAGFSLPLLQGLHQSNKALQSNQVRALILTPTRELAAQVAENIAFNRKYLDLSSTVVFGGVKINPQMKKLRAGVDVLVATPGRLLDLYQQNVIKFDQLETLVLDEADRMLDMGFIRDIRKILALLPSNRQNLLFSATFSPEIRELARSIMRNPSEISVTPENSTVDTITQWIHPVDRGRKPALLVHLIKTHDWWQVLVFSRTKHGANKLVRVLDKHNISALAIHGDKSQGSRTKALAAFKHKKIQVLVATDIAARGIDISQLPHVINFDLPHVSEDYVHRIGRTGRAGESGEAISLVCGEELKELKGIERLTQQLLERRIVAGFEPKMPLEETTLLPPKKSPRPKKNKKPQGHSNSGKQDKAKSKPNAKPNSKTSSKTSNKAQNKKAVDQKSTMNKDKSKSERTKASKANQAVWKRGK